MNAAAAPSPARAATVLFSDIEGSKRLRRTLGRVAYEEVRAECDTLRQRVLESSGGSELRRDGDALLTTFSSAEAAVVAAVAVQRALETLPHADGVPLRARIGIATDISGGADASQRSAQLAGLADGGEILLSPETAALVATTIAPGMRLEPHERMQRLVVSLVGEQPSGLPPLTDPLLEREAEVAVLVAHTDAAAGGEGRFVVIEAGTGLGKSRLLAEARRLAEYGGLLTLSARGAELERDFAYGIVRQLFEPLLAAASADERAALLDGAAAPAAAVFKPVSPDDNDAGGTSFATLHALYWLAANLAQRQPFLIAIDDLQWADGASLRWLGFLQRRLEGLALLVVVAARPLERGHEPTLLAEIASQPAAPVLHPGPLGRDAVLRLARGAFAAEPEPEFVDACHSATGGNPLFVKALLDSLCREGIEPIAAAAAQVLEVGPEPVARSVALTLARLPPEATDLARAVAVLGSNVPLQEAASLAGVKPGQAAHAAALLARADVLRPGLPLDFVHPVVGTSVYRSMDTPERCAAHRQAAANLVRNGAEPEAVAAHLERSLPTGDPSVVQILRRAADLALARGASEEAISFLRRALQEPPRAEERMDVIRALGLAERLLDTEAAVFHLRLALATDETSEQAPQLALELGRALQRANRHGEAIAVLQDGRDRARESQLEHELTAELISATWWDPAHLPIAEEEIAALDERRLADGIGADLLRAVLAFATMRNGRDRDRTLALAEAAVGPGRIPTTGSRALYQAGVALTAAGHPARAVSVFEEGYLEALRRGDGVLAAGCLLFGAHAHLCQGHLAAAEESLAAVGEHAEFESMRPYRAAFDAWLALDRGDADGAHRALAAAGLPDALPANGHLLLFHLIRGRVRTEVCGPDIGADDLLALGESARLLRLECTGYLPWRAHAAAALHLAGRTSEAHALARESLDRAREWGGSASVGPALRTLALVEGGTRGLRRLEEAVLVLDDSPSQLERALALVDLGAALRRANQRAEARDHLRAGLEVAHRLGAAGLRDRARAELVTAGGRPRRMTTTGVDSLTPSERRVVELAMQELTNKAIAQALFVTTKTVEVHLSNAYRKLGITSRTELASALRGPLT